MRYGDDAKRPDTLHQRGCTVLPLTPDSLSVGRCVYQWALHLRSWWHLTTTARGSGGERMHKTDAVHLRNKYWACRWGSKAQYKTDQSQTEEFQLLMDKPCSIPQTLRLLFCFVLFFLICIRYHCNSGISCKAIFDIHSIRHNAFKLYYPDFFFLTWYAWFWDYSKGCHNTVVWLLAQICFKNNLWKFSDMVSGQWKSKKKRNTSNL